MKSYGEILNDIRVNRLKYSYIRLSMKCDVSDSCLSTIEKGSIPSRKIFDKLFPLFQKYGYNYDELLLLCYKEEEEELEDEYYSLGSFIKDLRIRKLKLTLNGFSDLCGVSPSFISSIENNKTGISDMIIDKLVKVTEIYGYNYEYLIKLRDNTPISSNKKR